MLWRSCGNRGLSVEREGKRGLSEKSLNAEDADYAEEMHRSFGARVRRLRMTDMS